MKVLPFGFLRNVPSGGTYTPTGVDGALVILNGQTVNLTAPILREYSSIDIQAGGVLNISGDGDAAQITCAGSFNVDGEIVYRATERNGYSYAGSFVSGLPYNFTASQALGGAGGDTFFGGTVALIDSGGAQFQGFGGGGAGGACSDLGEGAGPISNVVAQGGAGGTSNGNGSQGQAKAIVGDGNPAETTPNGGTIGGLGGIGGSTLSNGLNGEQYPGSSGDQVDGTDGGDGGGSGGGGGGIVQSQGKITLWNHGGAGGGGGYKGLHGGILYIYSNNAITGAGQINTSGQNGFNGGNGSSAWNNVGYCDGGGGGGGAGGTGGLLAIEAPSYTPTTNILGGTGGAGGTTRGQATGAGGYADAGFVGNDGADGTLQVI